MWKGVSFLRSLLPKEPLASDVPSQESYQLPTVMGADKLEETQNQTKTSFLSPLIPQKQSSINQLGLQSGSKKQWSNEI